MSERKLGQADIPGECRAWVPVSEDRFQASAYRYVRTSLMQNGELVARFADGSSQPSVYTSVNEMLLAGELDWRERLREVQPQGERAS